MNLPDPRVWPSAAALDAKLAQLALKSCNGDAGARAALTQEIERLLDASGDSELNALLACAASPQAYRHVIQCIGDVIDRGSGTDAAAIARFFAMPLIVVAGGKTRSSLSGALPDIDAVAALFEQHGVLGATRNFGMSNALCSMETLVQLTPVTLWRWATATTAGSSVPRDIAGSVIAIEPGREQVHLRFLIGAAVAPAHAPSFLETASNIGAWGMALTKLLTQQLKPPGAEVLPIARAPVPLIQAADAGRAAQLELSFNLFLSNALRQFRMSAGEPITIISAHRLEHGAAELRVSLSSVFDESLLEGFRWPLYPADDMIEIINKINMLFEECKVSDVRACESIAAETTPRGGLFLSVRDAQTVTARH